MITEFTPLQSLIGGSLIGLSAVLLMLFFGRIAGVTGILSGLIFPTKTALKQSGYPDLRWRFFMVLGMIAAPSLYVLYDGNPVEMFIDAPPYLIAIAGFLVGFGVTLGSGCTSGHGVCGLSRLSLRSLVAVLVFMAFAGITVYVMRHVL